jgi:hypothetical protein
MLYRTPKGKKFSLFRFLCVFGVFGGLFPFPAVSSHRERPIGLRGVPLNLQSPARVRLNALEHAAANRFKLISSA